MNRSLFVTCFLGAQLAMTFTYISLRTCIIRQSFLNQRREKYSQELKQKKEILERKLIILHNEAGLLDYARNELGMTPIKISSIKMVDLYEQ